MYSTFAALILVNTLFILIIHLARKHKPKPGYRPFGPQDGPLWFFGIKSYPDED